MKFLLNLLFPKFCIGCKKVGRTICPACFQKIVFIQKQVCPYCRRLSLYGYTHEDCIVDNGIEGAISLLEYTGISKKIIRDIKYNRVFSEIEDFFLLIPNNIMEKIVGNLKKYNIDYIQPIPLHEQRQKIRGFNQSYKIAQYIEVYIQSPIIDILKREKNTSAQAQIKKKAEREYNIQNAFRCIDNSKFQGKNILLVDDLFTTGSTSKEAAKELKRNNIGKVFVLTLAHV